MSGSAGEGDPDSSIFQGLQTLPAKFRGTGQHEQRDHCVPAANGADHEEHDEHAGHAAQPIEKSGNRGRETNPD